MGWEGVLTVGWRGGPYTSGMGFITGVGEGYPYYWGAWGMGSLLEGWGRFPYYWSGG